MQVAPMEMQVSDVPSQTEPNQDSTYMEKA